MPQTLPYFHSLTLPDLALPTRSVAGSRLANNATPMRGRCTLRPSTRTTTRPGMRLCSQLVSFDHPSSMLIGRYIDTPQFHIELIDVLSRPGYMNYGSFGHVASHELTVRQAS